MEERKANIVVALLAHGVGHLIPFMAAEAGLVVRRDWLRPGLAVSATGLITIDLLLVKPPLWVDGLVTVSVLVGLWWIYRPANRKAKPVTR